MGRKRKAYIGIFIVVALITVIISYRTFFRGGAKSKSAQSNDSILETKETTFSYYAPDAKEVYLAGNMTDWENGKESLDFNKETGYWTKTKELSSGFYEYKYIVDGEWVLDPSNEKEKNGNSLLVVIGLSDTTIEVGKGDVVDLPKLLYYSEDGTAQEKQVNYTNVETQDYKVLDNQLTVSDSCTKEEFTLTAQLDGNKAELTIKVFEMMYTYTVHFYSPSIEMKPGVSDLYVWNGDDSNHNEFIPFDTVYEDDVNGVTWVTATIRVPWTNFNTITRYTKGTWESQESQGRNYNVTKDDKNEIELWYVDEKGLFRELPELEMQSERHLLVEYVNEEDPEGWKFYTWNNGYGNNFYDFERTEDGRYIADVKVKAGIDSISFCVTKANWARKDGGDHTIDVPLDQRVVRGIMHENGEASLQFPYNIGYEIDTQNESIHYYYRDDEKYGQSIFEQEPESVELVTPTQHYKMEWNSKNQRYEYTQDGLVSDTSYEYKYHVSNNQDVLDSYNTNKTTVSECEYSNIHYKKFDVGIVASLSNKSMSYKDNNVITVSFDQEAPEGLIVSDIILDLSELGLSKEFHIYPALMQGTIPLKESIKLGKKSIKVTLKDQYNNIYTTTTTVDIIKNDIKDIDWDEAVIYHMITDRFFNGDTSNDKASGAETYDTSNPSLYHGGDFVGLTQKLEYLKDLGVNTIWISPIVEQVVGVPNGQVGLVTGYHGYWANSFEKLNPTFGTKKEFKELVDRAHELDMKIMVDVILNHTGYGANENESFKNMLRTESIAGDDIRSSLDGLPDFLTEDPLVSKQLIDWQTAWVEEFGIDYFRVDTLKHVENETWAEFKNRLTQINPKFKLIGEYYGAGYASDIGQLDTGLVDSILDFDFNEQAKSFVTGSIDEVESFLEKRNQAMSNTATLGTFLSSHDEVGFLEGLREDGISDSEGKMKVAASLQITTKGQPVLYYGEEIGQSGKNNYPYNENRSDFDWSKANDQNTMTQHYKKMLKIRNQYSKLFAKGTRTKVAGSNKENYLVFQREYKDDSIFVGLNIDKDEKKVKITVPLKAGCTYVDEYSGKKYTVDGKQQIAVAIPGVNDGGTVVLHSNTK